MKARFPTATLVNATSAGAGKDLIVGLVPLVDRQFIMTYGYRTGTATVAGAIAPLDNDARTVRQHITRILQWAPAKTVILGVPYYGYDWPVTSNVPNATVQTNKTLYGPVTTMTYATARGFLALHPEVVRQYDAAEGSGFYTYWEPDQEDLATGLLRGRTEPRRQVRLRPDDRPGGHRHVDARQRPRLSGAVGRCSARSSMRRSTR